MNYNLISYLIYFLIMAPVIISVGYNCYRNGHGFILALVGDETMTQRINHLLLVGYYLVNIGFLLFTIQNWTTIKNPVEIFDSIATFSGALMLLLGILHYINMTVIAFVLKKKKTIV